MAGDGLQDSLEILEDFVIPEAEDSETSRSQPAVALGVRLAFEMLTSVDLNEELPWQAGEIDDVGPDGDLPAELRSQDSPAQLLPEEGLRVGQVAAEVSCVGDQIVHGAGLCPSRRPPPNLPLFQPPPAQGGGTGARVEPSA